MNHENKNRLLDFHFQEGSAWRLRRTRRHVEACPDCQKELRALAQTEQRLRAWPDEKPEPGTFDRILAALPEVQPRRRPERASLPFLPLAGIAAGIAFILLVLRVGRVLLAQFSFWERLQEGWLARVFGDFGLSLVLFLILGGVAALSLAPYLFDLARKSESCHSR